MTDQEWAVADPRVILAQLRDMSHERKLRLFACACYRQLKTLMENDRNRRAVEVSEWFADGLVRKQDLRNARRLARWLPVPESNAWYDAAFALDTAREQLPREEASLPRLLLRDIFGPTLVPVALSPTCLGWQDGVVRDLAWAAYNERTLPSGRLDPLRLSVLADALTDAGCTDEELLAHLREDGPHVRGCFAVDAAIGMA
jgi:hypothetical protein